jgi:hypothetical protein
VDAAELKPYEGRLLELRFTDGYAAVARLLDVAPGETGSELIYDVVEVLSWGTLNPDQIDLKAAHAADAAELESYLVIPGEDAEA